MCYPKPGPRCSQHALLQYAKIHREVLATYEEEGFSKKIEAGIKARRKAEAEYRITPAGIREMEDKLRRRGGEDEYLKEQIAEAKAERARRLAQVADKKQIKHRKTKTEALFTSELAKGGETLQGIDQGDAVVAAAIEESADWAANLTDEELSAFRWYTQDGYSLVNEYAIHGHIRRFRNEVPDEELVQVMSLLDSAFEKKTGRETRVVYRRHLMYDGDDTAAVWVKNGLEKFREQYKPGDIYKPGFYMSSSLNPDNGPKDDDGPVFMEILTRRAVSVCAISAQGSREQEYITPRDAQYRVVSTDKKVTLVPGKDSEGGHKTRTVSVIQLEEL